MSINWKPGDGTLTKVGWMWKCLSCGDFINIASDNVVPKRCFKCGGELIDMPANEIEKHEMIVKSSLFSMKEG